MRIDVLTIFPEMFETIVKTSIFGKALEKGIIRVNIHDIRVYAANKHKQVDDYPYGGGHGMVMSPQPLFDALNAILTNESSDKAIVICFSPRGTVLKQDIAAKFTNWEHLILICGHYEGIDQRVIDRFVDFEISIGDYVLTGGELPAMVFMDCICRLVPGVLGNPYSANDESFARGLLEYPQYTRPKTFEGLNVPDVLLSGNHKEIERFRTTESLKITLSRRPDLIESANLTTEEKVHLDEIIKNRSI
jgi:tRNA (guanine37-N1)-methyltransferase